MLQTAQNGAGMDERDIAIAAVMLPALIIIGGVVVMVAGIRHATPAGRARSTKSAWR